jgi:UDP-sulfoquinovose synthase
LSIEAGKMLCLFLNRLEAGITRRKYTTQIILRWLAKSGVFVLQTSCKEWSSEGVVFGTRIDEMGDDERLLTRFDFDQCFGTAINRYCSQAVIGQPLTPYGKGHQRRGFLPIRDSMQCLTIAIQNPPENGKYRVFNQFEEVYDLTELALKVQKIGEKLGLKIEVRNVENPRIEMEEHYYNPDHQNLLELGYQPSHDIETEMEIMLNDLMKYKPRIEARAHALTPDIRWDGSRRKVSYLG